MSGGRGPRPVGLPVFGIAWFGCAALHCPDPSIVATVGGAVSRALLRRVASRWLAPPLTRHHRPHEELARAVGRSCRFGLADGGAGDLSGWSGSFGGLRAGCGAPGTGVGVQGSSGGLRSRSAEFQGDLPPQPAERTQPPTQVPGTPTSRSRPVIQTTRWPVLCIALILAACAVDGAASRVAEGHCEATRSALDAAPSTVTTIEGSGQSTRQPEARGHSIPRPNCGARQTTRT